MPGDSSGVQLQAHDPEWTEIAAHELKGLRQLLGEHIQGAEHFGSTAISGLVAKPTIDLILATRRWPWPAELDRRLLGQGFFHYNSPNPRWRVYLKEREGRQRGFHLHIVEAGSRHWHDHLLFRDHLRSHPEAAQAYADLKRRLVVQSAGLGEYQGGKADLIRQLVTEARISAHRSPSSPQTCTFR